MLELDKIMRIQKMYLDESVYQFIVEMKKFSREIYTHSVLTALYTSIIADENVMSEEQKAAIIRGAMVHDIGKTTIPASVLQKKGKLNPDELRIMKEHSVNGYKMVNGILGAVEEEIVLMHHEKMDGTGYPGAETDIPEYVKMVTVADIYDALTSTRSYKKAYEHRLAIKILLEESGRGALDMGYVLDLHRGVGLLSVDWEERETGGIWNGKRRKRTCV